LRSGQEWMVSRISEIGAFLRLAQDGLAPETLAKAIRRRWPEVTEDELREAMARAAAEPLADGEEQIALDAVANAILKG
jgi:hypothetical protein